MKLLVTGASGFVGMRVCELAADEVVGVGRRVLDPAPTWTYVRGDLADGVPALPWEPDAVIHAAARATPYAKPRAYERDNVLATQRVLDFCAAHGHPRLVYVSSSSVLYRDGDQLGLTEESPVGPTFANDYARTKAAGEDLVRTYDGSWVVARPRAVYGPRDTVLFPRVLAAAAKGRLPLLTGRETPAMGDVVYVDNLAEQLLALARRTDVTGTIHLTNGAPVDMQALLLSVLERLGYDAPTRGVPISRALRAATVIERAWRLLRLPGEPPITRYGVGVLSWSKTFDPTKMLEVLGPPAISTDEGVDRFVTWQREQAR